MLWTATFWGDTRVSGWSCSDLCGGAGVQTALATDVWGKQRLWAGKVLTAHSFCGYSSHNSYPQSSGDLLLERLLVESAESQTE